MRLLANRMRQVEKADYNAQSSNQYPYIIGNISNVFLHRMLEGIAMSQPLGFVDKQNAHQICLFNNTLYGLKRYLC